MFIYYIYLIYEFEKSLVISLNNNEYSDDKILKNEFLDYNFFF